MKLSKPNKWWGLVADIVLAIILIASMTMITASFVMANPSPPEEVKWEVLAVQTDQKIFEVHLIATIQYPWRLYSQHGENGQTPRPTKIVFLPNPMVKLLDKPSEQGEMTEYHDPASAYVYRYYEDNVIFIQPVKLKDTKTPIALKGIVYYQVGSRYEQKPPATKEFSVVLEAQKMKQ